MAKTPEGDTKDRIKKVLNERNVFYKMIVPHPYGANVGISDFQLCHCGHFVVIEAKPRNGKKKPTQKQNQYMDAVDAAGCTSFVVRNEDDMSRVERFLDWAETNPVTKPPFKIIRDDQDVR